MAETKAPTEPEGAPPETPAEPPAPMPMGVDPNTIPLTRVSDVFDDPAKWADFPQVEIDDLLDVDIAIHDAMIFPSQEYEDREWAIVLFSDLKSGDYVTTATGGAVAMRKLRALKERDQLPIVGRFIKVASKVRGHQAYVDIR